MDDQVRSVSVKELETTLNRGTLPGQRGLTKLDIYHEALRWSSSSTYEKEWIPSLPSQNGIWILEAVTFACFMDTFDTSAGPKPYEQPFMTWGEQDFYAIDLNINHTFSSSDGWYFYFCGRIDIGLPFAPGDTIKVTGFTSGASKKRMNFFTHFRRHENARY